MRCFIAVDLPKDIKKQIHSIQKPFEKYENITLVNTKLLHCTLLFLGDIDKAQIQKTKTILESITSRHNTIRCRLKTTGVFPDTNYLKVIWAGISDNSHLTGIQKSIETELKRAGIYNPPRNPRQFTPHITLGRVRNPRHKHDILNEIEKNTTFTTPFFEIKEIKLKQSTLSQGGPLYHDIAIYKLREPA